VLANAIACLVDGRGRILVSGLRPPPIPANVRVALATLEFGGGPGDPVVDADWGEPGLSPAERADHDRFLATRPGTFRGAADPLDSPAPQPQSSRPRQPGTLLGVEPVAMPRGTGAVRSSRGWCRGWYRVATLMSMHPLIETHRAELLALARRRGVTGVRVFGSMSRSDGNDSTARSDVDLLVTLRPGTSALALGGLLLDAQDLLGRRVDVVTEASLHPALRERVLAGAVPL
jgi:uncharacterized protein